MTQERETSKGDNTVVQQPEADEIDLKEIIVKIWQKRRFILKVTGISLSVGIFIAFTSPVSYTAGCTAVPQTGQKNNSNLGGLAALAGINIGNSLSGELLSPAVYPEIIKSVPFTRTVMQKRISPAAASGKEIALYEFYSDKRYNKPNPVSIIKKYTLGLPGLVVSAFRKTESDTTGGVFSDSPTAIQQLSREEKRVYKIIQDNISFEANSKDGYIKLQYNFPEAEGAAQVADCLQKTLEQFVITYKSEKVRENLLFVEASHEEARKDFLEKQAALAAFQDANRGLITATGRSTENRLRSEYEIAFTVYNELAKQREQARLAVKENKPVLTVINPVTVPSEKSAPRRPLIMAVFLFLGLTVSVSWVLMKPFMQEFVAAVKSEGVAPESE